MLRNEAAWLQSELARLPSSALSPLLSVASGDGAARRRFQPWIAGRVFAPLEARGIKVIHHERLPGPGIDVAGDLHDQRVVAALAATGAQSVLCCNFLEHVDPRAPVEAAISGLVREGGFLIVTVPRRFPYHPDPIDTMFRPSPAELRSEFRDLALRAGDEVACGTLWRYLIDVPDTRASAAAGIRGMAGAIRRVIKPRAAAVPSGDARTKAAGSLRFLVRRTSVTCVILERKARSHVG